MLALLLFLIPLFAMLQTGAASAEEAEPDIFTLPGSGVSAVGQLPPLTILYNAMTCGELHPCPT